MNIGVMLPNWIGDVVMATPTLRALRQRHAEAKIVGIVRPSVAEVLAGSSWLDEAILHDHRSRDPALRTSALIRRLRALRLDKLLVLTNSLRSGLIAWLSGAKQRYGYARSGRGWLLNRRLYPPRLGRRLLPVSAVDYYLQLAAAAGCEGEGSASRQPELFTTRLDEAAADRVWRKFDLAGSAVVTLNSGGAYGAAKHWPVEHFAALARRLVDGRDVSVLVLCGPAEREAAAEIVRLAACQRVYSLAEETPGIGLSKACVRRSRLLVSTDSGPRHFAAAFGVPAVALFGPTDPRWSINYHPQEVHLQHLLDCQPCAKRVCPLAHHRCMRDLSVQCVFDAAMSLLESEQCRDAA
jgi:heptosyltransferase-2